MNASNLHLAQLEAGKISALGPLFKSKAPALWGLFQQLLVVESKAQARHWAKPAPPSAELGTGRDENGDRDHVSAGKQSKGTSSEKHYALLRIVSHNMLDKYDE